MIYNIIKGQYPYSEVIGTVEAPLDMPEVALQRAKRQLADKAAELPEEEAVFYRHPVVELLDDPYANRATQFGYTRDEYANLADVPF